MVIYWLTETQAVYVFYKSILSSTNVLLKIYILFYHSLQKFV